MKIVSMDCPNCGGKLEIKEREDFIVCEYCGSTVIIDSERDGDTYNITDSVVYIVKDDKKLPSAKKVPRKKERAEKPTGQKESSVEEVTVTKNKWIAFFLCLFFGLFGAHKFYEGNKWQGWFYLCTAGFWGVLWIFDIFYYLFKPNPYTVVVKRKKQV